jgi:hypothetical protein
MRRITLARPNRSRPADAGGAVGDRQGEHDPAGLRAVHAQDGDLGLEIGRALRHVVEVEEGDADQRPRRHAERPGQRLLVGGEVGRFEVAADVVALLEDEGPGARHPGTASEGRIVERGCIEETRARLSSVLRRGRAEDAENERQ